MIYKFEVRTVNGDVVSQADYGRHSRRFERQLYHPPTAIIDDTAQSRGFKLVPMPIAQCYCRA